MDPDVIFLGEIRDGEAARIAMRAASSGKHVFSTLHTRDLAGTVTSLRNLNCEDRSLAANLTGIISQRLVRRLCPHCRQPGPVENLPRLLTETSAVIPERAFRAVGCEQCRGTGYRGRIGVFETMMVEEEVRETIVQGAPEEELRQAMRSCGVLSLTEDALSKVQDGITSLDEVLQMRWM
jgi:general secretion pathway protein E